LAREVVVIEKLIEASLRRRLWLARKGEDRGEDQPDTTQPQLRQADHRLFPRVEKRGEPALRRARLRRADLGH
jgi:hypothetical protein